MTVIVRLHKGIRILHDFRLRNDLYCVGWGVKLYSLSLSHSCMTKVEIISRLLVLNVSRTKNTNPKNEIMMK